MVEICMTSIGNFHAIVRPCDGQRRRAANSPGHDRRSVGGVLAAACRLAYSVRSKAENKEKRVMRILLLLLALLGAICAPMLVTAPAHAQATRTWVSGVGDDANPCSRTAPCKTFAGAISKTAAFGEINCTDPGGFGGVTITKSIMIRCPYVEAGVLVSGTNGIVVNVTSTDIVYLEGIDILGVTTGINGISFIQAGVLHVKGCVIREFNSASGANGIRFAPTAAAKLFVDDSQISDNGTGATGNGILMQGTGAGIFQGVI